MGVVVKIQASRYRQLTRNHESPKSRRRVRAAFLCAPHQQRQRREAGSCHRLQQRPIPPTSDSRTIATCIVHRWLKRRPRRRSAKYRPVRVALVFVCYVCDADDTVIAQRHPRIGTKNSRLGRQMGVSEGQKMHHRNMASRRGLVWSTSTKVCPFFVTSVRHLLKVKPRGRLSAYSSA